jgi:hypothetical protein
MIRRGLARWAVLSHLFRQLKQPVHLRYLYRFPAGMTSEMARKNSVKFQKSAESVIQTAALESRITQIKRISHKENTAETIQEVISNHLLNCHEKKFRR